MPMEASEQYAAMINLFAIANSNVEIWLAATFATVLAFHFASGSITKGMYVMISGLYIVSSCLFIVRTIHVFWQFMQFNQMLIDAGQTP